MKQVIILIGILFTICSCASNPSGEWHKSEGYSPEEYNKARYICLKESQQPKSTFATMWPSSNNQTIIIDRGHMGPSHRESEAVLKGFEMGMQSHHKNDSTMVTNEYLFEACMNAHGFFWRLIE